MPTFKHPCPYCEKYIDGASVACPFCGVIEPFSRGRCPDCGAALQSGWIACPKCGRTLGATDTVSPAAVDGDGVRAVETTGTPPASPATPAAAPPPRSPEAAGQPVQGQARPAAARCTGCGAPLPAGARFCAECGTLV